MVVAAGFIVKSRAKAKSEHITIQATRTLKRAGTPLRGARALNVRILWEIAVDKKIDDFLSIKFAHEYSIKNFGFSKIFKETYGKSEELEKIFNEEIVRVEKFRTELAETLGTESEKIAAAAERWAFFLKQRNERFDFWSVLFTSFTAVSGIFTAIIALQKASGVEGISNVLPFFLTVLTLVFAHWKFDIDKKRLWYKYIIANLEAIKSQYSNKSRHSAN